MGERWGALLKKLREYRYVLAVAAVGLALMLWPAGGGGTDKGVQTEEEQRLSTLLTQIEGVGQARVLLSETGAVVVCAGAEDPSVRLRVTRALGCYTGLGANEVEIFMTDQKWRDES